MEKDRELICDAIAERAREHADRVLPEIIEMYQSAPWNEFRDALAEIFLAGAVAAWDHGLAEARSLDKKPSGTEGRVD